MDDTKRLISLTRSLTYEMSGRDANCCFNGNLDVNKDVSSTEGKQHTAESDY